MEAIIWAIGSLSHLARNKRFTKADLSHLGAGILFLNSENMAYIFVS